MSRSNSPLALSVVTLTVPGDVAATLANIKSFDDQKFGFSHDQTWRAMAFALRGELRPDAVAVSFAKTPARVQRCIVALCEFGIAHPKETRRFADYPEAGLRAVAFIDWDPEVHVRVKATCWYVEGGKVVIPILQPRKSELSPEQLAVYVRLVEQAYCQGDWVMAAIALIDLSGDDDLPTARLIDVESLPPVSDALISRYVQTFVEAKKLADADRKAREKPKREVPMAELLDLK